MSNLTQIISSIYKMTVCTQWFTCCCLCILMDSGLPGTSARPCYTHPVASSALAETGICSSSGALASSEWGIIIPQICSTCWSQDAGWSSRTSRENVANICCTFQWSVLQLRISGPGVVLNLSTFLCNAKNEKYKPLGIWKYCTYV